eukprot:8323-Heterococcus_DN1.PRE.8
MVLHLGTNVGAFVSTAQNAQAVDQARAIKACLLHCTSFLSVIAYALHELAMQEEAAGRLLEFSSLCASVASELQATGAAPMLEAPKHDNTTPVAAADTGELQPAIHTIAICMLGH